MTHGASACCPEIAFNAKYLSDVLAVLDSEGLHIELTEPLRPGVIRPTDDADYLCVDADASGIIP